MATEVVATAPPAEQQPAPPPAPAGPTQDELIAALNMERLRAAQLEQETLRARQNEQAAWVARSQPEQPQADPYKKVFEDGLVNPEAAGATLRQLIENAADRKSEERARQIAAAMAQQQQQNNVAMSFNSFAARNPDLASPENQPRLAGAVVQADMEARRQGLILPQDQLLERAARSLRQANPRPTQAPAYVEGGSTPALSPGLGTPQPAVAEKNELERRYGMEPGMIEALPDSPDDWDRLAVEYVNTENKEKMARGIPLPNLRVKG